MHLRTLSSIVALVSLSTLAGCATGRQWSVSGGDREAGLVRISYEYPEFKEPKLSDQQAAELAASRCDFWGFDDVEPIAGQIRQCSNKEGDDCELWRVTREYQCTKDVAYVSKLAK
jgi:hypothetical protein